jgi:hypothetical protein
MVETFEKSGEVGCPKKPTVDSLKIGCHLCFSSTSLTMSTKFKKLPNALSKSGDHYKKVISQVYSSVM